MMEQVIPKSDLEQWLEDHSYLKGIADFQQSVAEALNGKGHVEVPPPDWGEYAEDFAEGVPIIRSIAIDKEIMDGSGALFVRLLKSLSENRQISDDAKRNVSEMLLEFGETSETAALLVEQVVLCLEDADSHAGLSRFLCWRAFESVMRPWMVSFALWRKDYMWDRPYCPFCGSPAAMAHVSRTTRGRERLLLCGHCGCNWSYQRTRCPFCGNYDQDKMEVLALEREESLRLDVCHACNGYLKTYVGNGKEELLLADWTTIHLDMLAGQEGFERRACSLYAL